MTTAPVPTPPPSARLSWVVAALALAWGTFAAWDEQQTRTRGLDVDGWGYYVDLPLAERLDDPGRAAGVAAAERVGPPPAHTFADLFRNPSLWKGPVVPFVYGAGYLAVPNPYTPIAVNVLAFAASAFLLHRRMVLGGGSVRAATAGMLGWVFFPPHKLLFGYYFAEPLITLASCVMFGLVNARPHRPVLLGAWAGLTLLARPPFLLVVAAIPLLVPLPPGWARWRWAAAFALGFAVTFLPWGVRNLAVTGHYIPFTAEGGKTLFHGTFLGRDSIHWAEVVKHPEAARREAEAPGALDAVGQMTYWGALGREQLFADVPGQALHMVRKGMRFWVNVPDGEWVPTLKSAVPALVFLPLGVWAAVRYRRLPVVMWCTVWVLGVWAMHAALFGVLRYNFPVLPMMLFLAASAVWPPRR